MYKRRSGKGGQSTITIKRDILTALSSLPPVRIYIPPHKPRSFFIFSTHTPLFFLYFCAPHVIFVRLSNHLPRKRDCACIDWRIDHVRERERDESHAREVSFSEMAEVTYERATVRFINARGRGPCDRYCRFCSGRTVRASGDFGLCFNVVRGLQRQVISRRATARACTEQRVVERGCDSPNGPFSFTQTRIVKYGE